MKIAWDHVIDRTRRKLALFVAFAATAVGCGGAYSTSSTGIDTTLAGVSVVDDGIRLEFAQGLSLVLRFDGMTCASDSSASCVRSFTPAAADPRPQCAMARGEINCTSPGGEVTASAAGSFRAHLHRATGDLVVEGAFDRSARSGSFHYAATGSCACEAGGSFSLR